MIVAAIPLAGLLVTSIAAGAEDGADETIRRDDASEWAARQPQTLPIAYRNDGFSRFFRVGPMSRQELEANEINPPAGTNATILAWKLEPGSVFCFDTRAVQVFGEPLSEEQMAI